MKTQTLATIFTIVSMFALTPAVAQSEQNYDLTEDHVLYMVGYAHLDTEWRWDYPTTINKYLKNTLDDNFRLFEKYPDYVFNFTGSRRYKLMHEYYPGRYDTLKKYIDRGRWRVSGSSVDEGDVNAASPESVIRQVLYGNQYFRKAFGKESVDYMLPDCFGFQAHLPSVWAHCGIKGFSTQKLKWGSAVGVPFNVGRWKGPDGESVIMVNSIRSYGGEVEPRVDTSDFFLNRLENMRKKYGFSVGYSYYGVGDIGGAPREEDVRHLMHSLDHSGSDMKIVAGSSDQLYRDMTPALKEKLPVYKGDFLLTEHSAASITSQAYMKRWNRMNEKMAQSAELSAAMADWTGAIDYPFGKLNDSWELVLGSQMHDIIPGTSIPSAYHYAWNDEVIAMNGFAAVEKDAVGAFSEMLDTDVEGRPIVVYNPVSRSREDIVEVTLRDGAYNRVQVYDPEGRPVATQIVSAGQGKTDLIFSAKVPSAGYAVYEVRPGEGGNRGGGALRVSDSTLENACYRVRLNGQGDVASVYDKRQQRELLESPVRLAFLKANPRMWPAWNMSWRERIHKPVGYVGGNAQVRIKEKGPVRVALEVTRQSHGSTFRQTISLAAGEAGQRLTFDNKMRWQTRGKTLKAVFPLKAHNFEARYNLGLGTIQRPSNHSRKYEVPSRRWIDLTDTSGLYGISILDNGKHGSDKPDGNTLRLTLLHTPVANTYHDQATQDFGTHRFTYALYGHSGNWNKGGTEWQGLAMNQPLQAYSVPRHEGPLGKTYSFATLNSDEVAIRAFKKAEDGQSYIVRLQELSGNPTTDLTLDLGPAIVDATEVDGQERPIGQGNIANGNLHLDMQGYAIRSFSLRLESPSIDLKNPVRSMTTPASRPVKLPWNMDAVSPDQNRSDGAIDDSGRTYPAEMLPREIISEDIPFRLNGLDEGQNNAVRCSGQTIELPRGSYNKVYILAAAKKQTNAQFRLGEQRETFSVQPWMGFVGQWDRRVFASPEQRHVKRIEPGYILRDNIAWFATHHHRPGKNVAYEYAYLFKYAMDVPEGARTLKLPNNPNVMVFAVTVADQSHDRARPLSPLYDELSGRKGFKLGSPEHYGDELEPYAQLDKVQKNDPEALFDQISGGDYANLTSLNGVTMTYYPEGEAYTRASVRGEKLLLQDNFDGQGKSLGSFDEVIWYDNGEGRYVMDLQQPVSIDSIRTYSPVFSHYGIPVYTVWATNDPDPQVKGNPKDHGWTYLGANRKGNVWGKAWNRTTIRMPQKARNFRHIMWVADQNWHGTHYFFEVDVFRDE